MGTRRQVVLAAIVVAAGALCGVRAAGGVSPPALDAPVLLYDGAVPLEVAFMAAPTVVDWDNDGRKDLLVGQFTYGYIWRYMNQGTDEAPQFDGGVRVESGGVPIQTSWG